MLIFILVAIVLFAALSFAVSDMMRGGSGNEINEERAKILASDILDYARALRQGVQNMRISNGCADTAISFDTPSLIGYANGTNTACQLFNASGGGVNYVAPHKDVLAVVTPVPDLYNQWYFTGGVCAVGLGVTPSGCSTEAQRDIVAFLPYVNRSVCIAINNSLRVNNPGGNPPIESTHAWPTDNAKFTGNFTNGNILLERNGQMAGCFQGSGPTNTPPSGTYHFFQVLLVR